MHISCFFSTHHPELYKIIQVKYSKDTKIRHNLNFTFVSLSTLFIDIDWFSSEYWHVIHYYYTCLLDERAAWTKLLTTCIKLSSVVKLNLLSSSLLFQLCYNKIKQRSFYTACASQVFYLCFSGLGAITMGVLVGRDLILN